MTRPIRVALVGLGDIAVQAHLPALQRSPSVELAALVEPDPGRRAAAAALAPNTAAVEDAEPVLADPAVDAVVLATPPWVTPGLARAALEAGKYVLAEKPLAPTLAEQLGFSDVAGARERLQIGLSYRHHPAIDRLRRVVEERTLGEPLYVQCTLADERADPIGDPYHYARRVEGLEYAPPIVLDGIHRCDQLNLILGDTPVAVVGWAQTTSADFASPNVNGALLRYRNGTLVRLEVIWLLPALPPNQFVVTGPRGCATLEPETFALQLEIDGRREQLTPERTKIEVCFARQLERFVDACKRGVPPSPGLDDALAASGLAERIARALETE